MVDGPEPNLELLTIGAFAARARLSPKALRLYDRLGLLAPAHVDEVTGYRYYRAGQAERARLVAMLRQLDMPLARIAEVVEAGSSTSRTGRLRGPRTRRVTWRSR
ncbi:MerR HTH family regulatory protein [Streptomyces sp. Ag82_O1-12]|nr:MerR HTH family regulatory protein [Streptomyces sp. Ag82_O1-12]SOD46034.1 MerR HTH family regulatory protein [Streptomyces sp. Ag82_G6-1]